MEVAGNMKFYRNKLKGIKDEFTKYVLTNRDFICIDNAKAVFVNTYLVNSSLIPFNLFL
jgi:hypothetical protein